MSPSAATTLWPASPSISASARRPRSNRLSPPFGKCCIIILHPLFRFGITADLGVEDEKTGIQLVDVGTHAFTVPLQQRAPLGLGAAASIPEFRVKQHVPDRHTSRLQSAEKLDPHKDRGVVVASAGSISVGVRQQSDPLVVADRMGSQSGTLREFADLHACLSSRR